MSTDFGLEAGLKILISTIIVVNTIFIEFSFFHWPELNLRVRPVLK